MSSAFDLIELSRQLKQERLFINAEREQLRQLNSEVCKTADSLYCLSWIARQQKANLNDLVRAAAEVTPVTCCQKGNTLENVKFIDGYKCLTYHESKIGETLKRLRSWPRLVALVLMEAERQGAEELQHVAHVIMSGVYGNTVMQEDEALVLQVLQWLIKLQVAVHDNPRKVLRKQSSAFGVFFKLFIEGLFSSRLFLTAALHKPVMQLLMEDEWFYDIDPQRALHRFPPQERIRRFGTPETPEHAQKTAHYRAVTSKKLMLIADRFISSIKNNMYCFPQSLCWLVSQLFSIVNRENRVSTSEARSMCADLVLALFICPAICDPEPLGITSDAPISYIARHNLMQVAQMLQVLAISTREGIDARQRGLYDLFSENCMGFLLNGLLDSQVMDQPPRSSAHSQMIQRTAMYMTMSELRRLLRSLRNVVPQLNDGGDNDVSNEVNSPNKQPIAELLTCVPTDVKLEEMTNRLTPNTTPNATPPGTPSSSKKHKNKERLKVNLLRVENGMENSLTPDSDNVENVILVSLGVINECPGMESEQKILEQEARQRKGRYNSLVPGEDDPISEDQILANEKRTRFSLSHDQDSIATSDNLEAISEAASSHSVGSDMENDNLSDMVSANVSGRGTPSISGRDTPLSQATCETDSQMEGQVEERRAVPDLPVTVQRTNREDVTDKFQKFEIEREEIKSTVSDTWSTDVLASDSEPPEQNQMERLDEIAEEMVRQNLLGVHITESEALETASDAWSTDVLASDTSELQIERLRELEQEEVSSVSSRSQLQDDPSDPPGASEDTPQPSSPLSTGSVERRILADLDPSDVSAELDDEGRDDASSDVFPPLSGQPQKQRRVVAASETRFNKESDLSEPRRRSKRDAPLPPPQQTPPPSLPPSQRPLAGSKPLSLDFERNTFSHSSGGAFRHVAGVGDNRDGGDAAATNTQPKPPIVAWGDQSQSLTDSGLVSMDTSFQSDMDNLTNQMSSGLKLTEQQNVHIDAKRLSASASVFDPLAPPSMAVNQHDLSQSASGNGNDVTHNSGTGNGAMSSYGNASHSSYNGHNKSPVSKVAPGSSSQYKANYSEQGARPKIVVNSNTPTPRIQLQLSDSRESKSGARGSNPTVRFDTGSGHPEGGGSGGEWCEETASGGVTDGLGTNSADASSPVRNENDDKDKKKSSTPSLFKSFKDKLSKGTFPVGMATHRPPGKQRKPKSHDKEERNVAVLIDFEKGGNGEQAGACVADTGDDVAAKSRAADLLTESSDDILAKYRRPAASSSPRKSHDTVDHVIQPEEEVPQPPAYDPANLENCKAFLDAKKKLRLVLSTADFQAMPLSSHSGAMLVTISPCHGGLLNPTNGGACGGGLVGCGAGEKRENELVAFLRAQLAEAINLQDKDLIARLHETIRCLAVFNNAETKRLLKSIREEHRSRSPYTSYLIRCRQGLLGTQAHLERLLNRVQRDKTIVNKYFLSVNVRQFLEKMEKELVRFIADFQTLSLSDEKTEFVEDFLHMLHEQMDNDPVWQMARTEQVEEAKVFIERNVMSHIYTHALYPNGDGDIDRDQILYEHMKKLGQVIRPGHKDLRIPAMYHYECPWPAAQNEIYMINAYKTPKDKLQCVLRCSSTIMNLLSLANEKSVPAADDFMPVLIYVLIKANPPSLLSTIQYVNSFYDKRLHGEEQYWWMQFRAGVTFIHTMDYDH